MPYEIRKVEPIVSDRRLKQTAEQLFPFDKLEVGEGFFVPNIDAMPPAELKKDAHTLRNVQNHVNYRNRKRNSDKVFKCGLYDANWIQVWRES